MIIFGLVKSSDQKTGSFRFSAQFEVNQNRINCKFLLINVLWIICAFKIKTFFEVFSRWKRTYLILTHDIETAISA